LAKRLEERQLTLELSEAARDKLAEEGFDPVYGARPLKRVIQREVIDKLAMQLLSGTLSDGKYVIIDTEGDDITFRIHTPQAA
jgi:ATP-dependent Clp protease ATP-binding subunit ClpC